MAQMVKKLPAVQKPRLQSLGQEDPLEKRMATNSIILSWRIPWTGYSPWGHKESDTTERLTQGCVQWSTQRNGLGGLPTLRWCCVQEGMRSTPLFLPIR